LHIGSRKMIRSACNSRKDCLVQKHTFFMKKTFT
jgi:hypothetical protein